MPQGKQELFTPALDDYGMTKVRYRTQLGYDRAAFALRLPFERTGLTRLQLYKRISDQLIPEYHEWHDWTIRQIEGMSTHRWVALAGCSGSAKTHNVAGFAAIWWLSAPELSSVIFCSTTRAALRKRGWNNVRQAYQALAKPRFGNFVDSRMMWQFQKGDDRHSISGIAVEEGSTTKVADNIKGVHTLRQMIIIDEATSVPEAIYDACSNMWSYAREFVLVMIGNPRSMLDQFGRFMEPKDGWTAVTVDTEDWETTPKIDGNAGVCIRFDAWKSPNILHNRIVSRHLPSKQSVEAAAKKAGSESDPAFWSNQRGFPPPEGIQHTVFSESMLKSVNAYGHWRFLADTKVVGGFDPSFSQSGDLSIFRPARVGLTEAGTCIELLPPVVIPLNAGSSNPVAFQLAEKLREAADAIGCRAENIVVDATAGGAMVCDVIERTWSPMIKRCLSQGRASDLPVSNEDQRKASDVYRNKATELWFQAREFFLAGQVRGLDQETALELVGRLYEPEASLRKRQIEEKRQMKIRMNKSPDRSDATNLALEAARRLGIEIKPVGKTVERSVYWDKEVSKAVEAITEEQYSPGNEQFEQFEEAVF